MKAAFAAALVLLAGCSSGQQVQQASAAVIEGCDDALAAAAAAQAQLKGGAANTATEITKDYLLPACSTASAMAKISADPTTAAWLAGISGTLKGMVAGQKA